MKTLGFGVIGLGMISEVHAKAIGDLNGCRLVAGFDSSEERAVQFGRAYGCRTYTSLDDFLADPDLDIVTVATPSGLHLEGAIAAAEAKKHVIVEKPLEITKQRCQPDHSCLCRQRCHIGRGIPFPVPRGPQTDQTGHRAGAVRQDCHGRCTGEVVSDPDLLR